MVTFYDLLYGPSNLLRMASFIPPTKPANPGKMPAAVPSKYNCWVDELYKYPPPPMHIDGVFNIDEPDPNKTKPIKKIDEFPNNCPRCDAKCYIGLYEIKHANPRKDLECR